MKYVITGSIGHISKPLAETLLKAGHDVTIVTSKADNASKIEALGAKAAVGSVEDVDFLTKVFTGADAVYTMVPPNFTANPWKEWIGQIGKNYTTAIKAAHIKYVVNLSSIGAHLPDGVGPVSGLHLVETALNTLTDVNIKHLRPAYFYTNFLANIDLVKHMNIVGGNFEVKDKKFGLVHPADIAPVAAEELLQLNFKGHTVRYIASDNVSTDDVAKTLGSAIGKPDLPWVAFTNEQAQQGMQGAGLPEEVATNYVEMGTAIDSGEMYSDYFKHHPETLGKTKLKDFAKEFAEAYNTPNP